MAIGWREILDSGKDRELTNAINVVLSRVNIPNDEKGGIADDAIRNLRTRGGTVDVDSTDADWAEILREDESTFIDKIMDALDDTSLSSITEKRDVARSVRDRLR